MYSITAIMVAVQTPAMVADHFTNTIRSVWLKVPLSSR